MSTLNAFKNMIFNNYMYYFKALILLQIINHIGCLTLIPYTKINPSLGSTVPYSLIYSPLSISSETDPFTSGLKTFGVSMPPPFVNDYSDATSEKAYRCSLMVCLDDDTTTPVCACNFNTGNVVTFKNSCDVNKHNCRFDTAFRVILNEICPWEFESRRINKDLEIDYNDPKYYN